MIRNLFFKGMIGTVKPVGDDSVGLEACRFQPIGDEDTYTVQIVINMIHIIPHYHPGHLAEIILNPIGTVANSK